MKMMKLLPIVIGILALLNLGCTRRFDESRLLHSKHKCIHRVDYRTNVKGIGLEAIHIGTPSSAHNTFKIRLVNMSEKQIFCISNFLYQSWSYMCDTGYRGGGGGRSLVSKYSPNDIRSIPPRHYYETTTSLPKMLQKARFSYSYFYDVALLLQNAKSCKRHWVETTVVIDERNHD
nr:putative integron gene cassette protein [uncultured bacterium]